MTMRITTLILFAAVVVGAGACGRAVLPPATTGMRRPRKP
jgi:hypothetical protein